jgi:hypothetical protein
MNTNIRETYSEIAGGGETHNFVILENGTVIWITPEQVGVYSCMTDIENGNEHLSLVSTDNNQRQKVESLLAFHAAWSNLCDCFDNNTMQKDYPFPESFDEIRINDWVNNSISRIKSIRA